MKASSLIAILAVACAVLLAGARADRVPLSAAGPLDAQLRQRLYDYNITPLDPGPAADPALVRLGQALFFDKELSGNRDTSCATCHHPTLASGDGLELAIGTGAIGLGPERLRGAMRPLVPRNATELFDRGSPDWHTMFWDGRVSGSPEAGFTTPLEFEDLDFPGGLDSVLAAQAMFPVVARAEMRGARGDVDVAGHDNELAIPDTENLLAVWTALGERLRAIPEYRRLFAAAYPGQSAGDIDYVDAANALAAFEANAFTFLDGPWDRYLAGDDAALSPAAKQGALLFYGKAGCARCHSGNLLTDQQYYNIGVPQFGPGKGLGNPYEDRGRARETERAEDRFKFRTPPLRNVTLTGPYMHNGAYADLEAAVRHHLDPAAALQAYDYSQLSIEVLSETEARPAIQQALLETIDPLVATPTFLSEREVQWLMAFLESLTDPAAADLDSLIPEQVPSGLPVSDDLPANTPFTHVTTAAGIKATQDPAYQIAGQAWGDYDGDGWLDLYLTTGRGPNSLYRNNGDGTFSLAPVNDQVALADHDSGGAVFADYDNDGWSDLYVLSRGPNVLLHNLQGLGFADVTAQAGVGDTASGKSASWADYDGDGDLDLYVANWACIPRCPHPFEGDRDTLYRNEGDGTFSDASSLLGSTTRGAGFIGGWTDYDNDGDLDLYVVNDEMVNPIGNRLFRNDGPGCDGWCFTDVAEDTGAEVRVMGMGLAIDDFDGDGWFDLYFSNVGTMRLLHNQGDGTFVEAAERTGTAVDRKAIGWGAVSLDYDNDGDRDLYLSLMANNSAVAAFNPLFDNQGDGTFTDLGVGSGAADPGPSVGLAYADYDNDGWVDLVVGNYDRGYHLYHNEGLAAGANRWLTLKLVGDGPVNRDAVGARVVLTTADGRRQEQEVRNSTGLGGGSDLRLHFGLGKSQVDTLEVRWPDGTKQTFSQGLLANHAYEIHHQGTVKET